MKAADEPRKSAMFLDWRNWSLMAKLGAVVLVPLIFAVTLGVNQIQWQVDRAGQFHRVSEVLDGVDKVEPLVREIQTERTQAVQVQTGSADAESLNQRAETTDARVREVDEVFADPDSYGSVTAARYREMRNQLKQLDGLRQQTTGGQMAPPMVIQSYSALINSVLALDRALTSTVADQSLSSSSTAIQEMLVLMEEVRLQQAWVHTGIAKGRLNPQVVQVLLGSRARLTAKVADAGAIVAPHWRKRLDETMAGAPVVERNQLLTALVMASTDPDADSADFTAQEWNTRSDKVVDLIDDGHNDLSAEVRQGAFKLEEEASNAAGRDSVLLLSALIAAGGVIIVITRQLLRSLRVLRRSALRSAEHELPDAVASIRAGQDSQATITPVAVTTTEEVGQVARAFEAVNRQALRLAAEQASLRHGYSESFVGVSRRSQALLERQLRLFEQLEADEEDPDQLARLFQLDHLATRMRRNNENLMVLSGADLARRFVKPTDLADVLRAAVSEIEQYPRVVLQPPPAVQLLGHVASDLVRLVAELLDNAANFSSPDTSVTASCYQAGDGSVTIDVLDEGIGMGRAELDDANARLSRVDDNDLATSRRMGLFVTGRLAVRHGVTVELHGGPDVEGVRATVLIPPEHLVSPDGGSATSSRLTPPASGQRNGFAHHDMPTSGMFSPSLNAGTSETPFSTPETSQPAAGNGSSLPRREPASPSSAASMPGMFDSTSSPPVDDGDRPTETLFTPIDIPEQPGMEGQDSAFDWPLGPEESGAAEQAAPTRPKSTDPSPQWFQPVDDVESTPLDESGEGGDVWPSDQPSNDLLSNDLPSRSGSTPAGGSWATTENVASAVPDPLSDPLPTARPDPLSDPLPSTSAAGPSPAGAEAGKAAQAPSFTSGGLPRRGQRDDGQPEPASGEPANGNGNGQRSPEDVSRRLADMQGGLQFGGEQESSAASSEGSWNFATDDAWRQAEAAVNQDPASYTSSGLPRRTPKAQLAPGSLASAGKESGPRYQRDADQLRGRLSSFQSGIARGRHRAPDEK